MRFLSVFTFLLIGFTYQVKAGGFENLLCPKNGDYRNATLFFPCNEDCQHQHGAVGGQCGDFTKGDYNCYCGKPTGTRYEGSLHCVKPLKDSYRNACTVDCICNHGALGGYCDWNKKACFCQGQGQNSKNKHCPSKSVLHFAKYIYDTVGEEGLGEHGMKFVAPVLSGKIKIE